MTTDTLTPAITVHRLGFYYATAGPDGLPTVIGRPEAMDLIRQHNGDRLPLECNFDVCERRYWQWTAEEGRP